MPKRPIIDSKVCNNRTRKLNIVLYGHVRIVWNFYFMNVSHSSRKMLSLIDPTTALEKFGGKFLNKHQIRIRFVILFGLLVFCNMIFLDFN